MLTVAGMAAAGSAAAHGADPEAPRIEGEHGLWVERAGASVLVGWLTPTPGGGVLRRMESNVLVVGHAAVKPIASAYHGRLIAAHTQRHGEELLLLLVAGAYGYDAYRISPEGTEPIPLRHPDDRR